MKDIDRHVVFERLRSAIEELEDFTKRYADLEDHLGPLFDWVRVISHNYKDTLSRQKDAPAGEVVQFMLPPPIRKSDL